MIRPSSDEASTEPGASLGALPARPLEREVRVRAALSHHVEPRNAVQVCEWLVEPVAGAREVSLTLVLSENVSLSFVLDADDAQDLAHALALRAPAGA